MKYFYCEYEVSFKEGDYESDSRIIQANSQNEAIEKIIDIIMEEESLSGELVEKIDIENIYETSSDARAD